MTFSDAPTDDADLVSGVLAGDRAAFAGVYEKYADRLYDFAFSMLRNREEASDCVADSFVVMAEKLGQLRDASRLRPWLYSVVRNECLRTLRGRGRLAHDDEWLEAMPDETNGPEQQVVQGDVQAELSELVWAAAEGLNDRDRALLDLHLRQGLDGAELAAAMDVTPANAYVMLSRVRDQVERSLGALLIARRGSDDCDDLAELLKDWDGGFSPLIRKRVARHIDGCDVCESRRKLMVSPLALLAGVPAFAAPAALKDRVLDDQRLVSYYVDAPVVPAAPVVPGGPTQGDSSDKRRALLVGLIVLLLALGGTAALVLWPDGDDDLIGVDSPTSSAPTTPASEPTPPTPSVTASGMPTKFAPSPTEPSSTATSDAPTVAAPADLQVSTRSIRLGASSTSGTTRLSNVGGTALDFTAQSRAKWLSVSTGSGSLDPAAQTTLRIRANRSGLSEGAHSGQVAINWSGGTVLVTVSLTVNRPPVIGTITATGTDCTGRAIAAAITDKTGVRSARVNWSGPSGTGQATMSLSNGKWRANIGPFPIGGDDVTATITATDRAGLRSTRKLSFNVDPCPG
ncbi:sigma-70 family RNA polymerase sigma factor [Nocardioides sp. WS12]|uniref:sigma-70 family RNA polymerase sigma factor n=1 Tax=Nocardioides sp. WS12 TaxID=2486272 RepID=UPI0015FCF6C3|nr:sigma-70 family RNA polymerase sigma factor [Nocardioides sp. WS12]